jgi:dCMP deaminase
VESVNIFSDFLNHFRLPPPAPLPIPAMGDTAEPVDDILTDTFDDTPEAFESYVESLTIAEPSVRDVRWLRACVELAPIFSTCTRRQYAAFIISANGRVVGFGYNGSPPGQAHCNEGACPRAFSDVPHGSPYDSGEGRCIAVHAEANALLFSDTTARHGATLYVNGAPCPDCAKLIAGSGVARVVHLADDLTADNRLEAMGIEVVQLTSDALA